MFLDAAEVSDSDDMVREAKLQLLPINRRIEPEDGISDSVASETFKSCRGVARLDRSDQTEPTPTRFQESDRSVSAPGPFWSILAETVTSLRMV